MQRLEEVDLASCSLGAAGATFLAVPVGAPASQLQILRLNGNQLGPSGVQSLAQAASCSPALQELHLADCGAGCEGGAWQHAPTAQGLSAADSMLCAGAAALGKTLALAKHLWLLDLSRCGIKAEGASSLASGLQDGSSLQAGAAVLVTACEWTPPDRALTQQVLRLRGNLLGPDAAAPLAQGVLAGSSLSELDLGSCQVCLDACCPVHPNHIWQQTLT